MNSDTPYEAIKPSVQETGFSLHSRSNLSDRTINRFSRQLAVSVERLLEEMVCLQEQLSIQPESMARSGGLALPLAEAEIVRQSLVASGFRLANELRKFARSQKAVANGKPNTLPQPLARQTTHVIDIKAILQSIRSQL